MWHTDASTEHIFGEGGMRKAHFESEEVKEYVAARGGALRISIQAVLYG